MASGGVAAKGKATKPETTAGPLPEATEEGPRKKRGGDPGKRRGGPGTKGAARRKSAALKRSGKGRKEPAGALSPDATPCPRCRALIIVVGERTTCPHCGMAVRFVDAPERPCVRCSTAVALPPGVQAVRCQACGLWQAVDPRRTVEARARCPRCNRRIPVPFDASEATCPHCLTGLVLADTL